jgi:MFS family permease
MGILVGKSRFSIMAITLTGISFLCSAALAYLFAEKTHINKNLIFFLRATFGLVNENITTLQSLIIARYFKKHYELILGVYFSVSYFIVSGSFSISPNIYSIYNEVSSVWLFGCIFALISFLSGIILFFKFWLI